MKTIGLLLCGLLLGTGCASQADALQSADGAPLDSIISMSSSFVTNSDKGAEVRRVVARNGVVSCELHTMDGDFYGAVPVKEWRRLWNLLLEEDPFGHGTLDVDEDDKDGGPYHKVRLERGRDFKEFSAQNKTDLAVFSSRGVVRRLQLSNAIVELVARHATQPAPKK